MPQETATKTEKQTYYKCTACLSADLSAEVLTEEGALAKEGGDEIFWNTHKEKYLKTAWGKRYIKTRLKNYLTGGPGWWQQERL